MKIPFDALCLAAVAAELQPLIGSRLEKVNPAGPLGIQVSLYLDRQRWLLLNADPVHPRAYLLGRRPERDKELPNFARDVKRLLMDARLVFARQRGLDRVLDLGFSGPEGDFQLVAELTGRHANLLLVDSERRVVSAAKWVGPGKSTRPVVPRRPYEPPPNPSRPSLLEAGPEDDPRDFEGCSPFLAKLIKAGAPLAGVQAAFSEGLFEPVESAGHGAYPLPVAALGLPEKAAPSYSLAAEAWFETLIDGERAAQAKASLKGQLERVILAREVALRDLEDALAAARDATAIQQRAELILAYQSQIKPGDAVLEARGYDGEPVSIALKPDLTAVENANRYFDRARRAKDRADLVAEQSERLEADRIAVEATLVRLEAAESAEEIDQIREEADARRWLHRSGPPIPKEDRPYEGHAIRELLSPGGWRVLYGENATSNDYLTTKVGRPSDLWFHVRGGPGSHVVLLTNNQPQRVQQADLEFAALVAARHSSAKHSAFVSVDYTQKRYVRKPRGAAPGLATYTNEKTLHVEPAKA
ncbi:MAG: NFACT family protein [Fimbriimonadaceae bacterium]|nr:NFACT family protein [Fimbriimonadaceae bacterium]QYK55224.1 MAG: NFACT family protein [Fimbriimonadaceae bacterium]